MATFVTANEIQSIVSDDFSLNFARVHDRWTHTIAIAQTLGGPRETIARAVETDYQTENLERIVSPVFQELHFQVDPKGQHQALLIGMSGEHHFSAVFNVAENETEVTLSVDVADRVRSNGLALSSTYTVMLASGDLADCDENHVVWNLAGGRFIFLASPPMRIGLAEAGRQAARVQASIDATSESQTKRWQYSWRYVRAIDLVSP